MTDHAEGSGHKLCVICRGSLTVEDPQVCERDLTETRSLLSGIVTLWLELPLHLGQLPGQASSGTRPAADGRALPGGDVLVLLGPGSEGLAEDGETTRDGDATSVAYDLTWWEAEWRQARADPAAKVARLGAAVRRAARYLEVHGRWAAEHHPGFADFHSDLGILHARLERATGRARQSAQANASCFDCGGRLIRRMEAVTVLRWWLPGAIGPVQQVTRWTGEVEGTDVACDQCRRRYGPAEYALALRAAGDSGLQGWVPISEAATVSHRSLDTLKSWAKRSLIASCCSLIWDDEQPAPRQGRQLVWWPDVQTRTEKAQRRRTAS